MVFFYRRSWLWVILVIALVGLKFGTRYGKLSFWGWGEAKTPTQAIINSYSALKDKDRDDYIKSYNAKTKIQKKTLGRLFDFYQVTVEYQKKIIKEYGPRVFDPDYKIYTELIAQEAWTKDDTTIIALQGGKAVVKPLGGEEEEVVRIGKDKWLMAWPTYFSDTDEVRHVFETKIKLYKKAIAKIGKDGYTAKIIDKELKKAIEKKLPDYAGNKFNPLIQINKEKRKGKGRRPKKSPKRRKSTSTIQIIELTPGR